MSYIPHNPRAKEILLKELGLKDSEELFSHIPLSLRKKLSEKLEKPLSEWEIREELEKKAQENFSGDAFLGFGYYSHYIPAVVEHLANLRPFVTNYTPYQAEVAQGTLQALFEYQSLMVLLTGMEIANASLYDGPTALVEALRMARRIRPQNQKTVVVLSEGIHPFYLETLQTYFPEGLCLDWSVDFVYAPLDLQTGETCWEKISHGDIFVFQNPNFWGVIEQKAKKIKEAFPQAQVLYGTNEPHSLTVLPSPQEYGADIVYGEGQSLGISTFFGGPSLGFLAAKKNYLRQMPGRLVGKTQAKTAFGEACDAYVITLATREQHIKREKATSNICSNQTLMAIRASIYMSYWGWEGLQEIYLKCQEKVAYFSEKLSQINPNLLLFPKAKYAHEITWHTAKAQKIFELALKENIYPGYLWENKIISYFCELTPKEKLDKLLDIVAHVENKKS